MLVDTNVILEAHRTGCWTQIALYFALHTVAKVVEETQTGYQNRTREEWIDEEGLRGAFGHIADITEEQRVAFNISHSHPSLDPGEKDLLIYAETMQSPAWLLNSPDMAAVRFAHAGGWIDRLVSLEAMTAHLKVRLKEALRMNYTERWLSAKKTGLLLGS
ncbi:MAG: hypothetical protein WD448_10065 [Woeseia sp.]